MKAKIVIAVICTVVIGYLGWSVYVPKDEVQPQTKKPKVEMEKEHKDPEVEQQSVVAAKKSVGEILERAKRHRETSDVIEQAAKVDPDKEEEYYKFVITSFPHLKDQVNAYREATRVQKERLAELASRVEKRNKDFVATGSASQSLDDDILYEQNQIAENARVLGKQAMALTEAIRQAAYN
ncbi:MULTISPECIES: hypothetical protein [Pseudoalteromonas]|uniref:Uncharacterized protein n=1 Tax=Pseudoalteromonas amylolytica TaxID=1859457 RepID=A0A1S1MWR5_9GAMM|nr:MULTISPECIES: hypothetical protein [Pseudoalteromonas]MCF6436393.1 hypothetical protein [Pseudoalteromonas sp. MMG022]OHU91890.1 hypothetical protein BFC16_02000 [Pseudoalteromonas sp. JW3]OHU93224.1 hypothetical protein BET10_01910 [Pseudoalteromonas amylolytica]